MVYLDVKLFWNNKYFKERSKVIKKKKPHKDIKYYNIGGLNLILYFVNFEIFEC